MKLYFRPEKSNGIDMLCSGPSISQTPQSSLDSAFSEFSDIHPGQLPKSDIEKQDYEKNFEEVPKPCKPNPITPPHPPPPP